MENFNIKKVLKSFTREILVPVVLALIVIQYVIQAFQIPSGSMEDSLLTGDFLLGLKFTYGSPVPFSNKKFPGYTLPEKGDVVIFRYPGEPEYPDNNPKRYNHLFNALMFGNFYWDKEPLPGAARLVHYADGPKDYIKRCVAVSGDTVSVHKGKLFVNGVLNDSLPGKGKFTATYRTKSPRDELENYVLPSPGDTLFVSSLPLDRLWWLRSLIIQENPEQQVVLDLSLLKNGSIDNGHVFEDFKVPLEADRGMALQILYEQGARSAGPLVQGDSITGTLPFGFFKENARIGFLPLIDPNLKGGNTRPVSYLGFEPSLLKDLEGHIAYLNSKTQVDTSSEVDSLEIPEKDTYALDKKLLVDGQAIEYYVVKNQTYFMMGDNRDNSADSRYFGPVALRNVKAKAFVIYFSFENEDQKFALKNPFTWWRIPFNIRFSRIGKIIHMI